MEALAFTVSATFVAMASAVLLGWTLGRLARGSLASMGLLSRLTEARGAVPLVVLAVLVARGLELPGMLTVGLTVGLYQAIAVARWIGSRRANTLPLFAGGFALTQSRVALDFRRAVVRGAVWITVAQSALLVVTLEAMLALSELGPRVLGLGAAFVPSGAPAVRALALCVTVLLVLAVDFGSSRLLRNGR